MKDVVFTPVDELDKEAYANMINFLTGVIKKNHPGKKVKFLGVRRRQLSKIDEAVRPIRRKM